MSKLKINNKKIVQKTSSRKLKISIFLSLFCGKQKFSHKWLLGQGWVQNVNF